MTAIIDCRHIDPQFCDCDDYEVDDELESLAELDPPEDDR